MWIEITETHVSQRATTNEVKAVNKVGAVEGNEPLRGIIDATTEEVRAAIQQNSANRLDANPKTIPYSLLNCALALIVYRFASRALSQEILVQDARYQEYSRALNTLDAVRRGEVEIEDPETGEMSSNSSAIAVADCNEFRFSRSRFASL